MNDDAPNNAAEPKADPWILKFLRYMRAEKGASVYTERNYRQALLEFSALVPAPAQDAARLECLAPG